MNNQDSHGDDSQTGEDITVLRLDASGGKSGRASPPKILKHRFVLDTQLGSGGMGTVYKAKDLRKVEARDRFPYLAIKVLNSDFSRHPEAFIALQREASKSQALSHPNIVSIFDFDKEGDTPFMTMELLEGNELAQLIKKYPQGMPDELAWPIITDMCAGLKRAHDEGITHADFKPGNVFVCKDRTSKILDFGIARAVHVKRREEEDTVFDPSKLAALTPAYASLEMLGGEQPQLVDDLYSLGIVIYQILSGRHPYDRVAADVAEREGLVPERLKRLSRRKWHMLEALLSFRRSKRPFGMQQVIERLLEPPPLWYWFAGAGIAAVTLISVSMLVVDATNISEAKETAAQGALIDAQVNRIEELIGKPEFDSFWEEQIAEEVVQLHGLKADKGAAFKIERLERIERIEQQVLALYQGKIEATADFTEAFALLSRADLYAKTGGFLAGREMLRLRLQSQIAQLLDSPKVPNDWHEQVKALLEMYGQYFPNSPEAAFLNHEAGQTFIAMLPGLIEKDQTKAALELYDAASKLVFDYEALEQAGNQIEQARSDTLRKEAQASQQRMQADYTRAMASLNENLSCQNLDLDTYKSNFEALLKRFPKFSGSATQAAMQVIAACVQVVSELNQDKAMSLKQKAINNFGEHAQLSSIQIDPCAMQYLINAGKQPGRSGYCKDSTQSGFKTPQLVVVSNQPGSRFAISKQEASWKEVNVFCALSDACTVSLNENMPVSGMSRASVEAYASWLSQQTGYTYRLPSYPEWQSATQDEVEFLDPNRNCQMDVSGLERGQQLVAASSGNENKHGLLHTAGNVREWVSYGAELVAVGASYTDPLSDCSAHSLYAHSGQADALTGFRLVRVIP